MYENNSKAAKTDNKSIKSIYSNKEYTSKHINDMLLDVINTLNSIKNINGKHHNYYYEVPPNWQSLDQTREYINHINQETQYTPPIVSLLKQNTESPNFEKQYEINDQPKEEIQFKINNDADKVMGPKVQINQEVNMVIALIKNIFEKIDDPDYICENETCQLLRSRQKNLINKKESLTDFNKLISNGDHKQKNIDQKQLKESISLIKNLKFNPKCKNTTKDHMCACSPIEEYYKKEGCSYIYYHGRILVINCPKD